MRPPSDGETLLPNLRRYAMTAGVDARQIEPGDIVETSGRRVGDTGRKGEIRAVLGDDDRLHYLVRWENGHESILYPGEGITVRPHDPEAGWAD
jgi:hypothetical protein